MNTSETVLSALDLFKDKWALATAGVPEDFNTCTVAWGSLGTLWTRPRKDGRTVTIYLHPARYTSQYFERNELFTVSFFSPAYREALAYLGSHSGRNENKVARAGLTPEAFGGSVTFKEAELTLLMRKIYAHPFIKEDMAADVCEHYRTHPGSFPPDETGDWQPHFMFIGEVLDIREHVPVK